MTLTRPSTDPEVVVDRTASRGTIRHGRVAGCFSRERAIFKG